MRPVHPARRRTWFAVLGLAFLLLPSLAQPAPARATITMTVDTTTSVESGTPIDEPDAVPGDGACVSTPSAKCTVRAAVMEADALGGIDVINIPGGTYTLTRTTPVNTLDAASDGDLDLTSGETIVTGIGPALTVIDAGGVDRVFDIGPSAIAYIGGLTIRNGVAKVSGISGTGAAHAHGGGIHNHGQMTLVGVSIVGSQSAAAWGGGGLTQAGNGANPPTNTATLINVTIDGNRALASGGGIENLNSSANSLRLNNVTITNNVADSDNDGAGDGGGIYIGTGTVTMSNTIVALNSDLGGQAPDCSGTLTSGGYNLLQSATGCTFAPVAGDQVGVDPQLGPLQDNGGQSPTRAPLPGSPVIDAGNPAPTQPASSGPACDSIDQRGLTRPQDGNGDGTTRCDIGAVELLAPALHVASIVFEPMRYRGCAPVGMPCLYARVKVMDSTGRNIAGASVTVELDRPDSSSVVASAITNRYGVAEFYFQIIGPGLYTVTVTDISKAGRTYDSGANVVTQRSYTVT